MRRYESIFIVDPDLSEDGRQPVLERFAEIVDQQGGTLLLTDEWGSRKLAYPIKKKVRGYYVRLDYASMGEVVDEIERFSRIDDRILKYMTVMLEEDADVEKLKAELAPPEPEVTEEAVAEPSETEEAAEPAEADEAASKTEEAAQPEAETEAEAATEPEAEPSAAKQEDAQ